MNLIYETAEHSRAPARKTIANIEDRHKNGIINDATARKEIEDLLDLVWMEHKLERVSSGEVTPDNVDEILDEFTDWADLLKEIREKRDQYPEVIEPKN